MTKEEKYVAVANKIKEANNRLRTMFYYRTKCERENVEYLDLYNPIFFKYNQHLMEEGKPISLTLVTDDDMSVFALAYSIYNGKDDDKYKILKPEEVSEEMLDEMLAVKDVGEVVQARMTKKSIEYTYNDYLAKKNDEVAKEKEIAKTKTRQSKWNDFNLVLSLIALGVSLIALIVKLC